MSSVDCVNPEDTATHCLDLIRKELGCIKAEFEILEEPHKTRPWPNVNDRLELILTKLIPSCIQKVTELECQHKLHVEEDEIKRPLKITQQDVNHIRKIHGHKYKDEADKDIPVTKYSQLFKSMFDPLYHTLEKTTFNLNEDESSFVVNRIFQMTYTKCTELMISKMTKQLEKLFVLQGELDGVEKERMKDTQYAFGLLLHAANIEEYQMNVDIDKIMADICKNELINSVFDKMGEQLKSLIKRAMEIIQSLLVLVPPLVVDCSPNPDLDSGAYPGKMTPGTKAQHYLTTQSALFNSYEGKVEAKLGEFSSIASFSEEILTQFSMYSFRSEYEGNVNSPTLLEGGNLFEGDLTQMKNASQEGGKYCEHKNENENGSIEIATLNTNTAPPVIPSVDPTINVTEQTQAKVTLSTVVPNEVKHDNIETQTLSVGKDSADSVSSRSRESSRRQNVLRRKWQAFVEFIRHVPSEQATSELQSELTMNTPSI